MMSPTEQEEIRQRGGAALCPVLHVMARADAHGSPGSDTSVPVLQPRRSAGGIVRVRARSRTRPFRRVASPRGSRRTPGAALSAETWLPSSSTDWTGGRVRQHRGPLGPPTWYPLAGSAGIEARATRIRSRAAPRSRPTRSSASGRRSGSPCSSRRGRRSRGSGEQAGGRGIQCADSSASRRRAVKRRDAAGVGPGGAMHRHGGPLRLSGLYTGLRRRRRSPGRAIADEK